MVNGTRSMYWEKGEKEGYRDKVDEMIAFSGEISFYPSKATELG